MVGVTVVEKAVDSVALLAAMKVAVLAVRLVGKLVSLKAWWMVGESDFARAA